MTILSISFCDIEAPLIFNLYSVAGLGEGQVTINITIMFGVTTYYLAQETYDIVLNSDGTHSAVFVSANVITNLGGWGSKVTEVNAETLRIVLYSSLDHSTLTAFSNGTLTLNLVNSQVKGMDTDVLTADALAASAVTEIQNGLATEAQVDILIDGVTVQALTADALASIDNALSPIDANLISINGNSAPANILEDALVETTGVPRIQADIVAVVGEVNKGVALGNAITGTPDEFIDGRVKAEVVIIDANPLTSIDNALSETHGPGSWDALASGNVTVGAITTSACQSIDSAIAENHGFTSGEVFQDDYSTRSGIAYPNGRPGYPVKLIGDAMRIAIAEEVNKIVCRVAQTILSADISYATGLEFTASPKNSTIIVGESSAAEIRGATFNHFQISQKAKAFGCVYNDCYQITGESTDYFYEPVLRDCNFNESGYLAFLDHKAWLYNCTFPGSFVLREARLVAPGDLGNFYFDDCSGTLIIRDLEGAVRINDFNGRIILEDSITAGAEVLITGGMGTITVEAGCPITPTVEGFYPIDLSVAAGEIIQELDELTVALGEVGQDVTLLKKYANNKQEFIFEDPKWYLVIYDDDDVTEIARFHVQRYGDTEIGSLVGSDTPSIRNKNEA